MKSNKILVIAVVALIIVNLVLISFIWINRPNRADRRNQNVYHERMINRQLGFDGTQEQAFRGLIDEFRSEKMEFSDKIYQSKKLLHESIFNPSVDRDSLLDVISELERRHELAVLDHQQKIYSMCDENQKEKFRQLMNETIRFRGNQRRGGPRR